MRPYLPFLSKAVLHKTGVPVIPAKAVSIRQGESNLERQGLAIFFVTEFYETNRRKFITYTLKYQAPFYQATAQSQPT